jgi:MFS family permease
LHFGDDPHRREKSLLCVITAFFWFAQYVYMPFLTPYLFALSMTATTVGLIIGAYGVTQLVLRIPLGVTVDIVHNHKLFILVGTFFAGVSSLGMMIFQSPALLFASNALSGVASSTWISFTVLYPSYYEKSEGAKAISVLSQFQKVGNLTAYLIGALLFGYVGIRGLFLASFAAGVIGAVLTLFMRREPAAPAVNLTMGGLVGVAKNRRLLFSSTMTTLMNLLVFGTVLSFTTSTAKNLGATGMQLGIFALLYSAAGIPGARFAGTRFASGAGEKTLLPLCFALIGIYCIGIASSRTVTPFFFLQIVAGFSNGLLASMLMTNAVKEIGADRKSTAMGFYQSIYSIGMTGGPMFMGFLVDHSSTRASFVIMALIAFACAAAIPPVYRSNLLIAAKPTTGAAR